MKIAYTDKFDQKIGRNMLYRFEIKKSILKTHFKLLMNLTRFYNKSEKTGYVASENKELFLSLCEKIEKSSDSAAEKSHQKSVEAYKNKIKNTSCDHADLGSLGYKHGSIVSCPNCGKSGRVW